MEYVYLLHTAASLDDQFLRMQVIVSYLLARNFVKIKKCLTIAKHYKQLLIFINGLKSYCEGMVSYNLCSIFSFRVIHADDFNNSTTLHRTIKTVLQKFNVVFRNLSINGRTVGFHPQAQK